MAGQDSTRGRAPRLSFGEGLLTRALELIASKPHWQKALFPRHERASRWQIAQDVCVEVCIQEGCQEWIKDKVQRGLIAKDARGRFQSTKQWGYNPLDVKLRELREEHDRCYEDLVMDETWQSWEDVPYEKRAKLRSRYPHHFTVHDFLYDTRASGSSLTPSTAGPSRPSATPRFEPTPTPDPRSKTPPTTPAPPALPKRLLPARESFTPQTIKKEIIEIEDSPLGARNASGSRITLKRERSPEMTIVEDTSAGSSSDDSYDDPEPPQFSRSIEAVSSKSGVCPAASTRPIPERSVSRHVPVVPLVRAGKGSMVKASAVPLPPATSTERESRSFKGDALVEDVVKTAEDGSEHADGPESHDGGPTSTDHEGDDVDDDDEDDEGDDDDEADEGEDEDEKPVSEKSSTSDTNRLLRAARRGTARLILACVTPGERTEFERTKAYARSRLLTLFRWRIMVRALDAMVNSATPPLKVWPDHAFFAEDFDPASIHASLYRRLFDLLRQSGAAATPTMDALLTWHYQHRVILTAKTKHPGLGSFTSDDRVVERITLWQLMTRFESRHRRAVLRRRSQDGIHTAKRPRTANS